MILLCWAAVILGMMVIGGQSAVAAAKAVDPDSTPKDVVLYSVTFNQLAFTSGQNGSLVFSATISNGSVSNLAIILLQTNASGTDPITSDNTYKVSDIRPDVCLWRDNEIECAGSEAPIQATGAGGLQTTTTLDVGLKKGSISSSMGTGNLFFCFAEKGSLNDTCSFYSSVFDLFVPPFQQVDPSPTSNIVSSSLAAEVIPSTPMVVTLTTTNIINLIQTISTTTTGDPTGAATTAANPSTINSASTVTAASSTPTSAVTASSNLSSKKSSSLSTGAKVGIALGALAFVALLLLAALFCLRKKHSKRARNTQNLSQSPPEQVMLTRDMHTDSFSRNLMMMEKDRNPSTTTPMPETPIETPPRRQSTLSTSPYEAVPSTTPLDPIITTSATTASNIPRRKPTQTTIISRSSSSPTTETHTLPSAYEAYHDIPVYGDARHVPQIFTTSGERGTPSPFLGEETEGMSPEEVARLEEEERRIDAAIAAAEAGR